MSELLSQAIGKEGKVKVTVAEGKVIVSGLLDTAGLDVELKLSLDSDYFIDQLGGVIPGDSLIEKGALELLKGALKKV